MGAVNDAPPIMYDADLQNVVTHADFDQLAYFYHEDFGTQAQGLIKRRNMLAEFVFE